MTAVRIPRLLLLLSSLALLTAGCARQEADSLQAIRERGELIVGVFGDIPPFAM